MKSYLKSTRNHTTKHALSDIFQRKKGKKKFTSDKPNYQCRHPPHQQEEDMVMLLINDTIK
jgi:hypothetical protein